MIVSAHGKSHTEKNTVKSEGQEKTLVRGQKGSAQFAAQGAGSKEEVKPIKNVVTYHYCFNRWFARHYHRRFEFAEWREIERPPRRPDGRVARPSRADREDHPGGKRRKTEDKWGGY